MLKAPFSWFGGKRLIAPTVWQHLGHVRTYIEPFGGSLAVLLGRPEVESKWTPQEIVNDANCFVPNFWRSMRLAPEVVATHFLAGGRLVEADLHAIHQWLTEERRQVRFREAMLTDPDHYDPLIAARWMQGQACWIGDGWCAGKLYRKLPKLLHSPEVCSRSDAQIREWFAVLSDRLRHVRVACGGWQRVLSDFVTCAAPPTGVFLDPPYINGNMSYCGVDPFDIGELVEWAQKAGETPARVILCGREGDYQMPGWRQVRWTARGGWSNKGGDNSARATERLWLSPACL